MNIHRCVVPFSAPCRTPSTGAFAAAAKLRCALLRNAICVVGMLPGATVPRSLGEKYGKILLEMMQTDRAASNVALILTDRPYMSRYVPMYCFSEIMLFTPRLMDHTLEGFVVGSAKLGLFTVRFLICTVMISDAIEISTET